MLASNPVEMMLMRKNALALVLVGGMVIASPASSAYAQAPDPGSWRVELDSSAKARLLQARDRIWRAWFTNDSIELARLLPPAVVAAEGIDGWEDRPAILAGSRRFAASGGKFVGIRFFDTEIVSYGNIAIVHARYEVELENGGQRRTNKGRATEIFVRRGTDWVNPFWHLES